MKLTLRLANQDTDTGQVRTLETGRLTVGRGADNDWVLADPDRTLSKNHCRIDASEGGFLLTDLSTNGVFLAGAPQPVGRGHSVALEDGDVVALGPYRLHAVISGQDVPALAMPAGLGLPENAAPAVSPLTPAIPEPWLADVPGAGFGPGRRAAPQGWDAPPDPATYAATGLFEQSRTAGGLAIPSDPFADSPSLFSGPAEHVPAGATSMRLPQAQVVLPSDWMEGEDPVGPEPAPGPAQSAPWPPPLPEEPPAPLSEASILPADWVLPSEPAAAEPPAVALPASWQAAPAELAGVASAEAVALPPPAAVAPAPAAGPVITPPPPIASSYPAPASLVSPFPVPASPVPASLAPATLAPAALVPAPALTPLPAMPAPTDRPAKPVPATPPVPLAPASLPRPATPPRPDAGQDAPRVVAAAAQSVPVQSVPVQAAPVHTAPAATPLPPHDAPPAVPGAPDAATPSHLVAAFLDGAGLPADSFAAREPAAAFRELGQLVRAAIEGVREIMSTRALVKSEFRVDQTVLRRSDNNPVKFAPDTQRCLAAMVGEAPPGFLPGPAAMQQSMDDIKLHELALVAALNSVFADLGTQLDPETISRRARQDAGLADKLPYARDAKCWAIYTETYAKLQESGAANTGGSLLAPLAEAYARQLRRGR